jgi:hypothetical protein
MNYPEHVETEWPELTGNYVEDLSAALKVLKWRSEDLKSLGGAMMTMGMEHPGRMLIQTSLLLGRAHPHFFAILREVTAPAMKHAEDMSAMMLKAALVGLFDATPGRVLPADARSRDEDDNGPSDSDIAEMQADEWIASQEEAQIEQMIEDQQIDAAISAQEEEPA